MILSPENRKPLSSDSGSPNPLEELEVLLQAADRTELHRRRQKLAKRRTRLRQFYELRKIPLIKEHACRILLMATQNNVFPANFYSLRKTVK